MADSDFWRDLAEKFRAISDPDGLLRAHWQSEKRRQFEWSVRSAKVVWGGLSARAQFEALAARGGSKVENPNGRDLLSAWFDALNKEIPSDRFESSAELVDGKPAHIWGSIYRICEASATFCNILERRALEVEGSVRESEAKRGTAPDRSAAGAYPAPKEFELEAALPTSPTAQPESGKAETLGEQIDRLREECRLSIESLAAAVERDPTTVSRHISNKLIPQLRTLGKYERVFSKRLNKKVVLNKTPVKRR